MIIRIITNIIYFGIISFISLNILIVVLLMGFHLYMNHVIKNINLNDDSYLPDNIFNGILVDNNNIQICTDIDNFFFTSYYFYSIKH